VRTVGVEIVGAIGRRPGRRRVNASGVSTDSRTCRRDEVFFALKGARCDGHDFVADVLERGAAAAVIGRDVDVSPDHRDRLIRVEDTLRALGDSGKAYRRAWSGTVIAVTGSNGKTTTREMIHHIHSIRIPCRRSPKSYNTDIGVPLTLFLAEPGDEVLIVEMGTNAPGEISALAQIAEPDIGVITNIGRSHLEGLGSEEGVARAKAELLQHLKPNGVAFLNADDPWTEYLSSLCSVPVTTYGVSAHADFRATDLSPTDDGHDFTLPGNVRVLLNIPGRHNVSNAVAAFAVAQHMGIDLNAAAEAMRDFTLPDLRYQVETVRGVTIVADCYNANPDSMRAAVDTFVCMPAQGRRIAVLGDMMELGPASERLHHSLGRHVGRSGVDALWAVGGYADCLADSARAAGLCDSVFQAQDIEAVTGRIGEFLRPGDAVLIKGSRGMQMERLADWLRENPVCADAITGSEEP